MARRAKIRNPSKTPIAKSIAIEVAIGIGVYLVVRSLRQSKLLGEDYSVITPKVSTPKFAPSRPAGQTFYQQAKNALIMPTFQKPTQAQIAKQAFESPPPVDPASLKFMAARAASVPEYKIMEQVDFSIDKAPATAAVAPRPIDRPTSGGPSIVKDAAKEAAYQTLEKLVADSDTVKTLVDGAIKDAAGSSFKYLSEDEVKGLTAQITPMIGHAAREVAEEYVEQFEKDDFPPWLRVLKLAGDYKSGAIEKRVMEKVTPKATPVVAAAVIEARKRQVKEIGAGAVRGFFKLIDPDRPAL